MALTIQEGKCYRTRDGRDVGPMERAETLRHLFTADGGAKLWAPDGTRWSFDPDSELVAEVPSGPVRKVTRREIVPGTYGIVHVATAPGQAAVWIENKFRNPEELRDAASVLNAIADALSSPALTDPNNEQ